MSDLIKIAKTADKLHRVDDDEAQDPANELRLQSTN
jgi:hypothetical protein